MSVVDMRYDVVRGGRVKGSLASARLQWLVEQYGERVLARVLAAMPQELASDVTNAHASGWSRLETLVALDAAISEVCGPRAAEQLSELAGDDVCVSDMQWR